MAHYLYYQIIYPNDRTEIQTEFNFNNDVAGFGPLSPVNIIIGQNNSGKSRLLRHLYNLTDFSYTLDLEFLSDLNSKISDLQNELDGLFKYDVISIGRIEKSPFQNYLTRVKGAVSNTYNPLEELLEIGKNLINVNTSTHSHKHSSGGMSHDELAIAGKRMKEIGKIVVSETEEILKHNDFLNKKFKRIYIPIIRGMRPVGEDNDINYYRDRTIKDYFPSFNNNDEEFEIFTGLELYESFKAKILGEPIDSDELLKFQNMLSNKFFQSKEVQLKPKNETDNVHIKIGDEPQRPIYDLGDGIQNLIIITFNMFFEKNRCLFFIEEPDISMHPAMQRELLELFIENDKHQYFITTHSNHFIDMTLDYDNISIFHTKKEIIDSNPTFTVNTTLTPQDNILADIGVRNSSVFLSNSTIWIEGHTDRFYIKKYMKKYLEELQESNDPKYGIVKHLVEDKHYSFFEYQGSNIMHWTFDPKDENFENIKASFICGSAILIADGDIETKRQRKKIFNEMLGKKFIILDVKEIENLIPVEILRLVMKDVFQKNKTDPEIINFKDYSKKIGLGEYLDGLLNKNEFIGTSTGTINKKLKLCKDVVKLMAQDEIEWKLNSKIEKLCSDIYDHIIECNN